jgi:hypothetical protein
MFGRRSVAGRITGGDLERRRDLKRRRRKEVARPLDVERRRDLKRPEWKAQVTVCERWAYFFNFYQVRIQSCWRYIIFPLAKQITNLLKHMIYQVNFRELLEMLLLARIGLFQFYYSFHGLYIIYIVPPSQNIASCGLCYDIKTSKLTLIVNTNAEGVHLRMLDRIKRFSGQLQVKKSEV